jgi:hypothetical protein
MVLRMTLPIYVSASRIEIFDTDGEVMQRIDLTTEKGRAQAVDLARDLLVCPMVIYRRDGRVRGIPGYALAPVTALSLVAQIGKAVQDATP